MALKAELEAEVSKWKKLYQSALDINIELENAILLHTQVTETNKLLGQDVVRLEKELHDLKITHSYNIDRLNIKCIEIVDERDKTFYKLTKLQKKYKIARKFIQSINKV